MHFLADDRIVNETWAQRAASLAQFTRLMASSRSFVCYAIRSIAGADSSKVNAGGLVYAIGRGWVSSPGIAGIGLFPCSGKSCDACAVFWGGCR